MTFIEFRRLQRLRLARAPANLEPVHLCGVCQTEMQPAFVRGAESATAGYLLQLLVPVPENPHLGADRTAVDRLSFELELYPMVVWRDRISIEQNRTVLICHHCVQRAAILKIGQRH